MYEKDPSALPSMVQLESLRANSTAFLEKFGCCIIGKETFRKYSIKKRIGEFLSNSDEAMALLIMKNNYDVWKEMAAKIKEGDGVAPKLDECEAKQIYFVEGKGRGRSWSNKGKQYYNEMYQCVKEDRDRFGKEFDNGYLQKIQGDAAYDKQMKKENRKMKADFGVVTIKCVNDFTVDMLANNRKDDAVNAAVPDDVGISEDDDDYIIHCVGNKTMVEL